MSTRVPEVYIPTGERIDRMQLPPYSEEAEAGVISAVVSEAEAYLDSMVERGVTQKWFFDRRHQLIWEAILTLYGDNKPVDIITLSDRIRSTNKMDECGGSGYVYSIPEKYAGNSMSVEEHVSIIEKKWTARKTIDQCRESIDKLMEGAEPTDVVSRLEVAMMGIGSESTARRVVGMRDLSREVASDIEEQMKGTVVGIKTGLKSMDRIDRGIGGLSNGNMIVIAGRPSMGKTSLAMTIAANVAYSIKEAKEKSSVVVFSLEMSAGELTRRMVANSAGDAMKKVGPGLSIEDGKRIAMGLARTSTLDGYLIIDDSPGVTINRLMAKARHYKRRNNAKLIIIDYLQLVSGDNAKLQREQEVAHVSKSVKRLARELDVPVIALAQMNRESEKEKKRKPRLADLRESGQIEQDADIVGILYSPEDGPDDDTNAPKQVNLRICKARNGRRDFDIPFMFVGQEFQFKDVSLQRED